MDFEGLTPELQAKAQECGSIEELVELAKDEGMELTDEQLESLAGGSWYEMGCKDHTSEGCKIDR